MVEQAVMCRVQAATSSDFSGSVKRLWWGVAVALVAVSAVLPRLGEALTWTRVEEVPVTDIFSLQRRGTILYAGAADVVYIGANEGTNWSATSSVDTAAVAVETVLPAGGALWVGTFARGVYRSTNGGTSWDAVDTGLTGLGSEDVVELVEKSGHLYAASGGAGVFVLDLAAPTQWSAFNAGFPVFTAGSVQDLVLHGTTLVAPAGANGFVYRFPEGATEWQEVAIVPPIAPGLLPTDLIAVGEDLFISAPIGVYRSPDDAQTWTITSDGLTRGTEVFLAADGAVLFAGVDFLGNNHRLYRSADRGDSWQPIDEIPGAFLYALEVAGDRLFAARADGLWWTPLATTGVRAASWDELKSRFRK